MIDTLLISARGLRKAYASVSGDNQSSSKMTKPLAQYGQWNRLAPSENSLEVLKGVDLDIHMGDALCIMGSSGAGKSTLMHLLGGLDRPTSGTVSYKGQDISRLSDDELSTFRNKTVSFVFQFHHLLAEFSAIENVMMPSLLAGDSFKDAKVSASKLLAELGLESRAQHRPSEMSGGEQQRVAIARALIRKPAVIFADEPTGNLDRKNGDQVQSLLFELQRKHKVTLVAVTHDPEFARKFSKVRTLRDGQWY